MIEAQHINNTNTETVTASTDLNSGDIVECPSGRAGVVQNLRPIVPGEEFDASIKGRYAVKAATATTFAAGVQCDWDGTNRLAVRSRIGRFRNWHCGNREDCGANNCDSRHQRVTPHE